MPTGLCECPVRGEVFKSNPVEQGEMARLIEFHLEVVHGKKKPREDVNKTAARVVPEATKD